MKTDWFLKMFGTRKLTSAEIEMLRDVYGDEIDYEKVRIHDDHWTANVTGFGAFVIGNDIQLGKKYIGDRSILIREAAHVWQFQGHWKWNYFFNALFDHIRARIDGHDPYDYSVVEGKKPWGEWNAEQQAQWIMHNEKLPADRA